MLLLSSPRCASAGWASLLLLAAALLHVTTASLQAAPRCPSHLDCAKEGRHFCKTGSSQCGPCLYPLEENEDGLCAVKKRHHQKAKVYSDDLDEEIDFLHAVIEKQRISDVRPGQKQDNHFADISFQSDGGTTRPHAPVPKEETQNVQTSTTAAATGTTVRSTTRVTTGGLRVGPIVTPRTRKDKIVIVMISVCAVVGIMAVILAAVCAVKLHRDSRLSQKVDYPAFGGATVASVKANGTSFGDQRLAQSAQMFHYQHQKQQMLSMGQQKPETKAVDTDATSDEEDVGGDFTVYECPGLAPTGEMEVKNPLFDDSTLPYQGTHK
uniref:Neural proliferation, differentiation and control, 1a n=1 Tax=Neogobius melanostomus TaxID=47308 RepID=A0A8C6SYZ2_9GOBI